MALDIKDVIILGKMGFNKKDIAALMGAQPSTPAQTTPAFVAPQSAPVAPQSAPAAPVAPQSAPAEPDYGALVAGLADLSEKINALSVPSAGFVGNPAPVTSVEDIILGAYQPSQADAPAPDFMKGVNNNGKP